MKQEKIGMLDNPEFRNLVRNVIEEKIPFCRLLGMKLTSFDPAKPEIRLDMHEHLLGNFTQGMLHGGVIASMLDTVAGFAIFLRMTQDAPRDTLMQQMAEFAQMSTIDLRVDYLQPGRGQYFTATAEVSRLGKRVANVLMSLNDEHGARIATGAAAFMLHGRA
jgi:uncharacterized protein (TIGR00369 family)